MQRFMNIVVLAIMEFGPTRYHGCRDCDYSQVSNLPVFLLNNAPFHHVLELNHQNQRALFAKILIIKFWRMVKRGME